MSLRHLAVAAFVALPLGALACSETSPGEAIGPNADAGEDSRFEPPPVDDTGELECEQLGYPCSLVEEPAAITAASAALLETLTERRAAGESLRSLADWTKQQPDVADCLFNEVSEALSFRVNGGVPRHLLHFGKLATGDVSRLARETQSAPFDDRAAIVPGYAKERRRLMVLEPFDGVDFPSSSPELLRIAQDTRDYQIVPPFRGAFARSVWSTLGDAALVLITSHGIVHDTGRSVLVTRELCGLSAALLALGTTPFQTPVRIGRYTYNTFVEAMGVASNVLQGAAAPEDWRKITAQIRENPGDPLADGALCVRTSLPNPANASELPVMDFVGLDQDFWKRRRSRLGRDQIVILDACHSGTMHVSPSGAGAFFGWDDEAEVHAATEAMKIVGSELLQHGRTTAEARAAVDEAGMLTHCTPPADAGAAGCAKTSLVLTGVESRAREIVHVLDGPSRIAQDPFEVRGTAAGDNELEVRLTVRVDGITASSPLELYQISIEHGGSTVLPWTALDSTNSVVSAEGQALYEPVVYLKAGQHQLVVRLRAIDGTESTHTLTALTGESAAETWRAATTALGLLRGTESSAPLSRGELDDSGQRVWTLYFAHESGTPSTYVVVRDHEGVDPLSCTGALGTFAAEISGGASNGSFSAEGTITFTAFGPLGMQGTFEGQGSAFVQGTPQLLDNDVTGNFSMTRHCGVMPGSQPSAFVASVLGDTGVCIDYHVGNDVGRSLQMVGCQGNPQCSMEQRCRQRVASILSRCDALDRPGAAESLRDTVTYYLPNGDYDAGSAEAACARIGGVFHLEP